MIRITCWSPQGVIQNNVSLEECQQTLLQPEHLTWVDIYNAERMESERVLREIFGFHPLAIADALEETHIPKIDNWEDYICLVMRAVNPEMEADFIPEEIDIFLGSNYIVTYHQDECFAIDKIWKLTQREKWLQERGPSQILYYLLDETADAFILFTDKLEIKINDIEDHLFDHPDPSLLEDIFSLKRDLLNIRQIVIPQREILDKLARGDYQILGKDSNIYFHDVYDHYIRLYEIIENLRDLTNSTLEIFLSVVNNRMNGIMKTLTVITTLFMPISFLAGFFGMNFFKPVLALDHWTSSPVFPIVLAAMIIFPFSMLFYMFKKGWMK